MRRAAIFLLPALLAVLPQLTRAQVPVAEPAPGVFLVAKPEMPDPRFRRSVILLLAHDGGGSMGLIVNQPTTMTLPDRLGQRHPIYRGGPVGSDQVIVLGRGEPPEGPSQPVWEDVWWSSERGLIEALLADNIDAGSVRVFLGYAGWDPGQLEAELDLARSWGLIRAHPDDIFSADPSGLWDQLMGRQRPLIAFGWSRAQRAMSIVPIGQP